MKTYKFILILLIALTGTTMSQAQTEAAITTTEQSIKAEGKYGILVMNPQHLKAAIKTGKTVKAKSTAIDVHIVTCGKLVKEISTNPELQNLIKSAVNDHGLNILVCGLSIEQFEVDTTLLPVETPVTQNGLIYMLGLQEQGFKTIIL
ncbi:DsrE family protein [Planktosalinus lacus]|uniref:DsrE/DsrF-like family protein n=1 Tax=Planktosalinus lacus TaxID=1526573 RepID=A0A8J2VAX5_9FLAO|nr:DsrE family protein [Planktosalinus lacus]GGD96539.1 hypothetical protein GCM10011312_20080 [Planktosalinus lacus]